MSVMVVWLCVIVNVTFFFLMIRRPPRSTRTDTLFPYTTLFRSNRQLRRCGTEHEPLHRVGLAVGGELGLLLGRVRPLTVEAASDIGFDLHLGALVGHFGHERAIEHRELGSRSEERRVGDGCFRTCRSRWSPYN